MAIRTMLDVPRSNPWKLSAADREKSNLDGAWGINFRSLCRYEELDASVPDEIIRKIFLASRTKAKSLDQDPQRGEREPLFFKVCALQCETIKQAVDSLLVTRTDFILDGDIPASLRNEIQSLAALLKPTNKEEEALAASLSGKARLADEILRTLLAGAKEESFRLCVKLAENWMRNGEFDQAIDPLREAIALNPGDTDVRFKLVRAHLYAGDGDVQAHWLNAYELLQRKVPRNDAAWIDHQTWLGIAWFKRPNMPLKERLRQATRFFRRAISGAKDDPHAAGVPRNHLAVMLFLSGTRKNQNEARGLFEKTMTLWSEKTHPYNWGLANLRMGNLWLNVQEKDKVQRRLNLNRAKRYYEAAERVNAASGYRLELAQVRYSMADLAMARAGIEISAPERLFDQATKLCEQAIGDLSPRLRDDWHRAHFNLAESFFRRPNPTEHQLRHAVRGYEEAAAVYANGVNPPDWAWTHYVLAGALLALARLRQGDCGVLVSAISSIKAAVSVVSNPMLAQSKALRKELQQMYTKCRCSGKKPITAIRRAR